MANQTGSGDTAGGFGALLASLDTPLDTRLVANGIGNLSDYLSRRRPRRTDDRRR